MRTGAEIGLKYVGIIVCVHHLFYQSLNPLSMLRFYVIVVVVVALDCAPYWETSKSELSFGNKMLLHISLYSWFELAGVWMEGDGEDSLKLISLAWIRCLTSPPPCPHPQHPKRLRPKLRNWLYKRCFETWGQCSSGLFFISSPAGFQNFQKCDANNDFPGSLSWSPQLETNFCFCGFSFTFLLHGTCEHCFVS